MIDTKSLTKRYYSISEVAEMLQVSNSLLRFWETEFPSLKPIKGKNGIRRYTAKEIQHLCEIHNLVKEKKYTIEGAKEHLKSAKTAKSTSSTENPFNTLKKIKTRLETILKRLDGIIGEE